MARRPRFRSLALRYGRHDGSWSFPERDTPVVIAGPNGSGKTTLVEGLLRTVFGFDRRRARDARDLEARRPWAAKGMGGRVVLEVGVDRMEIRRDFHSGEARVLDRASGCERFAGDGNPAARNQEAAHYHRIIAELLGLRDLSSYARTLYVRQGDLPENALADRLLRVAAGGHALVEAARRQLAEMHRSITRRPLHADARTAINPRPLEQAEDAIEDVRARLAAAREAGERRGPLAAERDRAAARLDSLDRRIVQLEDARSTLARAAAVESRTARRQVELRRVEAGAAAVRVAAARLEDAGRARAAAVEGGRYPDDFPERVARAEVRWRDLEIERRWPAPWLGAAAVVLLAVGALALAGGPALSGGQGRVGALGVGAGLLLAVLWGVLIAGARRRRETARREAAEALEGVPGAGTLGPGRQREALDRYAAQQASGARLQAGRDELASAIRSARSLLEEVGSPGPVHEQRSRLPGPEFAGSGRRCVRRVLAGLAGGADRLREDLARDRIERERVGDPVAGLPDGTAATEEDVAAALRTRRAEREAAQDELRTLSRELLERGTPAESVAALESRLAELVRRRDELERKARTLEAAHALVDDAYRVFRDRDQDRLARRVSFHVRRLSGSRLGPVEADGPLEQARVRLRGHTVALTTPPLSYGEFHALQLAVRLGAADFLAGVGIHPPLVIDEPFAHLDRERAAAVWHALQSVATDRQVIVTTRDERLLDDLAVDPDVRLRR